MAGRAGRGSNRDIQFWSEQWLQDATAHAKAQLARRRDPSFDGDDLVWDAIADTQRRIDEGQVIEEPEHYAMRAITNAAKTIHHKARRRGAQVGYVVSADSLRDLGTYEDLVDGNSVEHERAVEFAMAEIVGGMRKVIAESLGSYPAGPANAMFRTPAQYAAAILNEIIAVADPFDGDRRPTEAPDGVSAAYWLAAPDVLSTDNSQTVLYKRLDRARDNVYDFGLEIGLDDVLDWVVHE